MPGQFSAEINIEESVCKHYKDNGYQATCHFPMYRVRKKYHTNDFFQFFDGRDGFAYLVFESKEDMMLAKLALSNRPLPEL